ncbi:MAG: type II toxin-antitoxin system PemK/MazF family toxin [Actinomycetes bacterium]
MRRGDIRLVNFEPALGNEVNKVRPAIIVSNDAANSMAETLGRGVVTVIPVTSKTDRVLPFQVLLLASTTGLPRDSKAQAEQIRSVSALRVGDKVGIVPHDVMKLVEDAVRLQLAID